MDAFAQQELNHVRNRLNRMQDELDEALKLVGKQTALIESLLQEVGKKLDKHHEELLDTLRALVPR